MNLETKTWQEAANKWKSGDSVWSAELGGIGPSYEQAIQVLLWEILVRWDGGDLPKDVRKFPELYSKHVDRIVNELNDFGFSGAQVDAAKATAYQFIAYGYEQMMTKLPDDRWILVSKNFPSLNDSQTLI